LGRAAVVLLGPLVVMTVTAYTLKTPTALGKKPRVGIVAAPRKHLGKYVTILGRRYRILDVSGGPYLDIWMPSRGGCMRWGRKKLNVRFEGKSTKSLRSSRPKLQRSRKWTKGHGRLSR
jgi:3D (Asp-Asp-Asp) domain-containing protein